MATYTLPPGAWLSVGALNPGIGGNAALNPGIGGNVALDPGIGGNVALNPGIGGNAILDPGIGGNVALNPGIGGNAILDPGIGGNRSSENRRAGWGPLHRGGPGSPESSLAAAAARLTAATVWRGHDPEWTYQDAWALRTRALNLSGARVVRRDDPRREVDDAPYVAARSPQDQGSDPIWRWGSEPRMLAVVADLSWRFAVSDSTLWYLDSASRGGRQVSFLESLSLSTIPADKRWYRPQIDQVLRAAIEREERLPEILVQADGFMDFFSAQAGIDPTLAPITFELLTIAQMWARPLVMALKHQVAARRPNTSSTRIVPVIDTPAHGALPSGHATIATLLSELLSELLFGKFHQSSTSRHPRAMQLDRLARRIAFNRVVAGVHFPIDNRAGYALGLQLAAHFMGLATAGPQPRRYDLELTAPDKLTLSEQGPRPVLETVKAGSAGVAQSKVLGVMLRAACRELQQLGVEGVPL